MEFYISPKSGQFYMINVLEHQWLSVTYCDHSKGMVNRHGDLFTDIWGSVILRYSFQGLRDLSIYVVYETLFHVYLHAVKS